MRGGLLREVVSHGGSTVCQLLKLNNTQLDAEKKKNAWKRLSVSEVFAAIFMRWCIAAHIAAATARITAFCMNGGSCELSSGKSRGKSQWPRLWSWSCSV